MGVPHDHLEHPVPGQFCSRPQIYSNHYESTCKGMAVAMPGVPVDLRLFERAGEPARDPWSDSPVRTEGKTGIAFILLPGPCSSFKGATAIELKGKIQLT
jgi:hypothetical protein